jgi:hypothetical protein
MTCFGEPCRAGRSGRDEADLRRALSTSLGCALIDAQVDEHRCIPPPLFG